MTTVDTSREILAVKLADAMAEKFDVDYHNFAIVQGNETVSCPPTLVYVARLGIYEGSWNNIRGTTRSPRNKNDYTVSVDEHEFDTRRGMTEEVYRSLVAQNPNEQNPDRPLESIRGGYTFPSTWLTGESAKPHWAPVGQVDLVDSMPTPRVYGIKRDSLHRNAYFRPAVQLLVGIA